MLSVIMGPDNPQRKDRNGRWILRTLCFIKSPFLIFLFEAKCFISCLNANLQSKFSELHYFPFMYMYVMCVCARAHAHS